MTICTRPGVRICFCATRKLQSGREETHLGFILPKGALRFGTKIAENSGFCLPAYFTSGSIVPLIARR